MRGKQPTRYQEGRDDRGPWFYVWGYPLSAVLVLVFGGLLSMLGTTCALAMNRGAIGSWLAFDSASLWGGAQLWRVVSYVLWNPPDPLHFAVKMLMLWWAGKEVEGFFGRRIFLKLCVGLVVFPGVVGAVIGAFYPISWTGISGVYALVVAYATLAPGVAALFEISLGWVVAFFLGVRVLSCVAAQDWGEVVLTVSGAAYAFGYVRYQQGRWHFPDLQGWFGGQQVPTFRVIEGGKGSDGVLGKGKGKESGEGLAGEVVAASEEEQEALASIDPLLEKIGRSGLASLTSEERRKLQVAREALLRQEEAKH